MKRTVLIAILTITTVSFVKANGKIIPGDANDDGVVNVADIVLVTNYILGKSTDNFNVEGADVNNDGSINATDIVAIVSMIVAPNTKNYSFALLSQSVVYDNSNHAAFTSIYDNDGQLLMAFREGTAHRPASEAEYGCIRVLTQNGGGSLWSVSATISDVTKDLRDPFITDVNGHLRMYIGYNTFEEGVYQHSGTVYSDYINGSWSEVRAVTHDLNHIAWLWKVREHNNKYYSVAYLEGEKPALLVSDDGVNWSTVTFFDLEGILTEADMCFVGETMYVCLRKDTPVSEPAYWGVASYPFKSFTWTEMERHIESPELLWLPYSDKLLLAGRDVKTTGEVNVTLFSASFDGSVEEITTMETSIGGDKGYPGLAYRNGTLYCGWYSGTKSAASISLTTWKVDEQ